LIRRCSLQWGMEDFAFHYFGEMRDRFYAQEANLIPFGIK
jgi:hypothetical protein